MAWTHTRSFPVLPSQLCLRDSQRVKGREATLHLLLAYLVFATVALSLQVSFHVQKITFLAWWSCNIRRRMILVYTSQKMIQG
ncbi:hypothetical protein NC651_016915 [Populus alba x Populus x berolinensis]|nr:hypothetical protein NC651_016915 [Populus alba x Populus x berolinensis]